jgi:tripartite-type tricarboxylate transporter receptor subunit TctC
MNKTTNSLMRTLIRFVFIYSLLLVTLNTAFAQYPNKPITIVVPYEVGGGVDQVARLVAIKLSAKLKQTVLIENRSGASNTIGMSYVANAKADGYTLGFITAAFLITPFAMEKHPYQPLADFAPIAMIGTLPMMLAVNGNLPVNNVSEFIAYAKARPGQLNWASIGSASSQGLAGLEFNQATKIEATQIAYKGSASGLKDVIAGTVQYLFNPLPSLIQHAENNSIKILGTGGNKPLKDYPQIPLINQMIPGFSAQSWYGVVAPAKTPSAITQVLNQVINEIVTEPAMQSHLSGLGMQPMKLSPSEFAKWMRQESAKDEQIFKTLSF